MPEASSCDIERERKFENYCWMLEGFYRFWKIDMTKFKQALMWLAHTCMRQYEIGNPSLSHSFVCTLQSRQRHHSGEDRCTVFRCLSSCTERRNTGCNAKCHCLAISALFQLFAASEVIDIYS